MLTVGQILPTDFFSARFPVSVKAVCIVENKVIMVKNEHGKWDLPGGKLRYQEELLDCLGRELQEELGVPVLIGPLLELMVVRVKDMIDVMVPVYLCCSGTCISKLKASDEHFSVDAFSLEELSTIGLAADYQAVILRGMKAHETDCMAGRQESSTPL